jgi:putative ABC transport system ATP-binding protein
MNSAISALEFQSVSKVYPQLGRNGRYALRDVSFAVREGAAVAVVGRSGSGKSTLLNLAGGIDLPSSGRVLLDGEDLALLGDRRRTLLRREKIGFVFQFFHLLPHLSVADNVALPEWIAGRSTSSVRQRIADLLERVGLADRRADPVQKLSGGEMQRVAICRALLRRPRLLLADEPTGSLDDENGRLVMDLLLQLARAEGSTLLFVTHSRELSGLADEIWQLQSGSLERP